jgi:hypothetical protein
MPSCDGSNFSEIKSMEKELHQNNFETLQFKSKDGLLIKIQVDGWK